MVQVSRKAGVFVEVAIVRGFVAVDKMSSVAVGNAVDTIQGVVNNCYPLSPVFSLGLKVENEYGSYGDVSSNPSDKSYMEKLVATARAVLGQDVVLFTTDGGSTGCQSAIQSLLAPTLITHTLRQPPDMTRGTLKGSEVYSVGDGCGNPQTCIDAQREFNAPGMSPFMCT